MLFWIFFFIVLFLILNHFASAKNNAEMEERKAKIRSSKKCPYCAERIQIDAKKCRYCHETLEDMEILADEELERLAQLDGLAAEALERKKKNETDWKNNS